MGTVAGDGGDASSYDEAGLVALFTSVRLDEKLASQAVKNKKFSRALASCIDEACAQDPTLPSNANAKKYGNLLYTVAGKLPANALAHRGAVIASIMADELNSNAQLDGCFEYLKRIGSDAIDAAAFREAGGIGIAVTASDVDAALATLWDLEGERASSERYRCVPALLGKLRGIGHMRWADQRDLKARFDAKVLEMLGPKTEADMMSAKKQKKKKDKAKKDDKAKEAVPAVQAPPADPYAFLPKPHENNDVHTTVNFSDARGVMRISNDKAQLASHLAATGGRVVTRFPPEPNGYLHIGHAKAMYVDFGMAKKYGGSCFLRYDDTNPTAEKGEYISHIQEIVRWMGWAPTQITYSSDYFTQLHALAVRLIEGGHAYVCHQTSAEISESRANKQDSPWRDRPIAESLRLFEDMRLGLIDEGKATLRMRMDMRNDNFNMYDLIAYRIKFAPHPHAGDGWCIYPSYDFTHCIVDSLENITHSLCTIEFEPRRASYYWLLEVLGLYKPVVWEYSRLNVTHSVMSKRKLNRLVTEGYVNGWDDPRLLTLAGLRRRGATPKAINAFCADVGITRNENDIPHHKLEHYIRADLADVAERRMAVLRPLPLELVNFLEKFDATKEGGPPTFKARRFPNRPNGEGGEYDVPMGATVLIERSDFREADVSKYFGLAPNKTVMLRYACAVKCVGFERDGEGEVCKVLGEIVDVAKPPKGVIHWVASEGSVPAEVRLYSELFTHPNPAELEGWLDDIDPKSLEVLKGARVGPAMGDAKVGDSFQFERLGYFCVDPDTTPAEEGGMMVLNRTCSLKESVLTKSIKK